MTNTERDVRVSDIAGASTESFSPDSTYPLATSYHPFLWWLHYLLTNEINPSVRVFCGLVLAAYSTDVELARATADALDVEYGPGDDAAGICDLIIAAYPIPPAN